MRHHARTSNREAVQRKQCMQAFAALPEVERRHREGRLSRSQVRAIAAAFAGQSDAVHEAFFDHEVHLARAAEHRGVKDYEHFLKRFVDRADDTAAFDKTERQHERRDARMRTDKTGAWQLHAEPGNLAGAAMHDILETYYQCETQIDWEKARAEHGVDATVEHLPRSQRQRYADALAQIFEDAVTTAPGGQRPRYVINLVMDYPTFCRELALLAGAGVDQVLDGFVSGAVHPDDPARHCYQSRTLDGVSVNPREVVAELVAGGLDASFEWAVRRAIIDAKGVVVDLGQQRTFTGSARLAAQIPHDHCRWTGCQTPVSRCQIDHLAPWFLSRQTNQANAAPLCGRHNRHKHILDMRGHRVRRNGLGDLEIRGPDGRVRRLE